MAAKPHLPPTNFAPSSDYNGTMLSSKFHYIHFIVRCNRSELAIKVQKNDVYSHCSKSTEIASVQRIFATQRISAIALCFDCLQSFSQAYQNLMQNFSDFIFFLHLVALSRRFLGNHQTNWHQFLLIILINCRIFGSGFFFELE